MEHHHFEKIKHKKHFFIKSFIISLVILILSCLIATWMYPHLQEMAANWYGVDADDYGKIFMTVFGIWKILIIQFTLIPAIAMAMIEGHIKKHIAKNEEC